MLSPSPVACPTLQPANLFYRNRALPTRSLGQAVLVWAAGPAHLTALEVSTVDLAMIAIAIV